MIKTIFLAPETDSHRDHARFSPDLFADLEQRLEHLFGAYSVEAEVRGVWRDDYGVVHYDTNFRCTIALSVLQFPAWVELIQAVARAFNQDAIYVEIAGQPDFVTRGA